MNIPEIRPDLLVWLSGPKLSPGEEMVLTRSGAVRWKVPPIMAVPTSGLSIGARMAGQKAVAYVEVPPGTEDKTIDYLQQTGVFPLVQRNVYQQAVNNVTYNPPMPAAIVPEPKSVAPTFVGISGIGLAILALFTYVIVKNFGEDRK